MGENAKKCNEFIRTAKGLFAAARRVTGLQQQLNLAISQLGRHLTVVYGADSVSSADACESCIAPALFEAHDTVNSGELFRATETFSRTWTDAERWLNEASKSLKSMSSSGGSSTMTYEDAVQTFWEQRFDGLDVAASSYVRLVTSLLPKSSVAGCSVERLLRSAQRLYDAYPTVYDGGTVACSSLTSLLNQRIAAQYLRMFLETRLTEETLDFCFAVQALETAAANDPPEEVSCLAQGIVARYVAASAPQQINVSGTSRTTLIEAAREVPADVIKFVEVKDELVQSMQCDDVLRQFNSTPFYTRLIHRLTPSPWSASPTPIKRPSATATIPRRLSQSTSVKPSTTLSPEISSMESNSFAPSPRIGRRLGRKISSALRYDSAVPPSDSGAPPSPSIAVTSMFQFSPTSTSLPPSSSSSTSSSSAPRPRSRNPTTLNGPSMDDIMNSTELETSFRQFLYEKGAERPLEFRKAVYSLLHKYFGSTSGFLDLTSDESNVAESSVSDGTSSGSSGSGNVNLKYEIAQIYEDYLVPRNDEAPIGVSYEMRCQLYGSIYDTDGPSSDNSCAMLLIQACNEVMTFMRITEHPLYILSERWRPIWKGRSSSMSKMTPPPPIIVSDEPDSKKTIKPPSSQHNTPRALLSVRKEDSRVRSRSVTISDMPPPSGPPPPVLESQLKRTLSLIPNSPTEAKRPSTPVLQTSSSTTFPVCGTTTKSGDKSSTDSDSSGSGSLLCDGLPEMPPDDLFKSTAELISHLQTRFMPMLQGISTSVKTIVSPADIPNHVSEVRTIVSILKLLTEIPVPSQLKMPHFDSVAQIYSPNVELVQFMVNAHKSIWEVTAKIAGLIRILTKIIDAHKNEKAQVNHYWKLYKQLFDLASKQETKQDTKQ